MAERSPAEILAMAHEYLRGAAIDPSITGMFAREVVRLGRIAAAAKPFATLSTGSPPQIVIELLEALAALPPEAPHG